jgi:hypothetical protein
MFASWYLRRAISTRYDTQQAHKLIAPEAALWGKQVDALQNSTSLQD